MTQSFAASAAFAPDAAIAALPQRAAGVARVAVFSDPALAADVWDTLAALAPASAYQTRAWVAVWYATLGRACGCRPLISVAYDAAGQAIGLMPLCVMNLGPLRLAEFAGGKDANYMFALFAPGFSWTADSLRRWLRETARSAPERIDLFALVNQPESWNGVANPLRMLGGQTSPAQAYCTALLPDAEAFMKSRFSGLARKKMRAKERKLGEIGDVRCFSAKNAAEAQAILDAFRVQKAQRMQEMGVRNVFAEAAAEAFLEQGALDFAARGKGGIELHALTLDDRVIATFGGAAHQGRFSGMFNSFDLDPGLTRHSLGEQLLSWLIQSKCREGLHSFDLGVGEARYKQTWCDTIEPLFDCYLPVSAAGWALYAVKAGKRRLKGAIKRSAFCWRMVQQVRQARAALGRA